MPIYEFHCAKCEKDSEVLVRSSKWKGTKCPHCGSTHLSKKLSVFASSASSSNHRGLCERPAACAGDGSGGCGGCCGGGPHRH